MAYSLEPFLIVIDFLEFILALLLRSALDFIFLCTSPVWYFLEAFQTSTTDRKAYDTILITGASGGIGRALALEFVRQNSNVNLFLLGRNDDRLMETKQLCVNVINKGGQAAHSGAIQCFSVDNRKRAEVTRIIEECDDQHPIDLMIANAGMGSFQTQFNDWFDRFQEMVDTNIAGTFNTVFPVMKRFITRKRGHIAFNASIASYAPLLGTTSAFAATKAFIRFMSEIIRVSLKYYNIDCTLINLGWIDTDQAPSGAKRYAKSPEDTASVIINGLYRKKSVINYPFHWSFLQWYLGSLHPTINCCINWLAMPGPMEPDHVFSEFLGSNKVSVMLSDESEEEQKEQRESRQSVDDDSDSEIVTVGAGANDEKRLLKP